MSDSRVIERGEIVHFRRPHQPVDRQRSQVTSAVESELPLWRIEAVDDVLDAILLADEFGISMEGLNELYEMKDRMMLHMIKLELNGSPRTLIEQALLNAQKDDKRKREKLVDLLKETKTTLDFIELTDSSCATNRKRSRQSMMIEELLAKEGTAQNLLYDFQQKIKSLDKGEVVVLVSGETSAGKTCLLNLLLGEEDFLPSHTLSTTSVITRVSYGNSRRAEILYRSGDVDLIPKLDKQSLAKVWEVVAERNEDQRNMASNVQEVRVYLPLDILKCGLVIVDTPGIGENDTMDEVLAEFISSNLVMGFVYVIKTDNAGGVQEDRLLALLKSVLERKTHSVKEDFHLTSFDPKSAIFVCNRWDLIPEEEKKTVRENALKKLGQCWPKMDPSQVLFLSTVKAASDFKADPDYVEKGFKKFLESIRGIFMSALDRRIKSSYKWMEKILYRSTHHLKSVVSRLDMSEQEAWDKMQRTNARLMALRQKSKETIADLCNRINKDSGDICNRFREYLKTPQAKFQLTTLTPHELPTLESAGTWEGIKTALDSKLYERFVLQLDEWEEDHQMITSVEENIVQSIKMQLNLLEGDLAVIEKEMKEDDVFESIENERSNSPRERRMTAFGTFIKDATSIELVSAAYDVLPQKLMTKLAKPFKAKILKGTVFQQFKDMRIAGKEAQYVQSPFKFAKFRAENFWKGLVTVDGTMHNKSSNVLFRYIDQFLDPPRRILEELNVQIPGMIESNTEQLNHIKEARNMDMDTRKRYEVMMAQVEKLRDDVREYGIGYIFVDDFFEDEVKLLNAHTNETEDISVTMKVSETLVRESFSTSTPGHHTFPRGMWSFIHNGYLGQQRRNSDICIKIYLPSAKIGQIFPEVAKLRCLNHTHVAPFLGIHHFQAPTPAFVFEGHVKTARTFLRNRLCNRREAIPNIIQDAGKGLEYIHRKYMVHMELTLNTITVNEDGCVKLTGVCLPRKGTFPSEPECIQAGDFVLLAPEVLNGECYGVQADAYAFGLVILECLFMERPFERQRKMFLNEFIDVLDPVTMLNLGEKLTVLSKSLQNVIKWCLMMKAEDRPSFENINVLLHNMSEEPILQQVTKRRSRPPIKIKTSPDSPATTARDIRRSQILRQSQSLPEVPEVVVNGTNDRLEVPRISRRSTSPKHW